MNCAWICSKPEQLDQHWKLFCIDSDENITHVATYATLIPVPSINTKKIGEHRQA